MSVSNPELQLAEEFVQHTNCTIFLTGKAGTGKTTFLHRIKQQSHKRLVITAPTGVAAINAGGVTLHSFFQMPFGPFIPGSEAHTSQHRFSKVKKNIIKSLDLLIIDEISMVRADLLDGVDSVLRRYRGSDLPFGGVQLLMIGDLHQLAPVVKETEWQLLRSYYDSPYFFSSTALRRLEMLPIELVHIYRQSDSHFIELLNRVRDNRLDAPTLEQINSRYLPDFSPEEDAGYITLCTHNSRADAINRNKLSALQGRVRSFAAELDGDFPEHTYPVASSLELKTGAQVMFARNDTGTDKRYFNGKIGKITAIFEDMIEVQCPDEPGTIEVGQATWENIEYTVNQETAEISQKIIGTFKQYPLKPAWAITIHKSQGLTFDKAIIDAQAAFAPGQVYVALSRCRTFEGMVLSSPLMPSSVKSDATVQRFMAEACAQVPTAEKLALEKGRYQRILLLECFDFQSLQRHLGRLTGLLRGNASIIQVQAGADIGEVQQQTVEAICTVGENFKRQLQSLFTESAMPADDPVILERLTKASAYFRGKFDTILVPFLDTLVVDADNKEILKRITEAIKKLREETAVKRAAVQSCADGFSPSHYLRAISAAAIKADQQPRKPASISYSEADVGHPELFQRLREWRNDKAHADGLPHFQVLHQKTLVQIAVHLPDSLAALQTIKGIGKRLTEKYGEELVALVVDYRQQHGIETVTLPQPSLPVGPLGERKAPSGKKEDSKKFSLELAEQGLSIAQIAEQRGLTVQTIEGHLAFWVKKGDLALNGLVAADKQRDIEEKIAEMPQTSLKALKIALGDAYSYGEINLVLAHLQHSATP